MNRKQRRARDRALKKQRSKADFEEKLGLFGMLEDECLSCQKPFDKKNKQMVTTWSVVVREKQNKVNLYCPDYNCHKHEEESHHMGWCFQ